MTKNSRSCLGRCPPGRYMGRLLIVASFLILCRYWASNEFSGDEATHLGPALVDQAAENTSLSVILPVTSGSMSTLEENLQVVLKPPTYVREVIIICLPSLVGRTRIIVKGLVQPLGEEIDIIIQPLIGGLTYKSGLLDAASHATSDRILLLGHQGLSNEKSHHKDLLLHAPVVSLPLGLRGCGVSPNATFQNTSVSLFHTKRLEMPFIIPSSMVSAIQRGIRQDLWSKFGPPPIPDYTGVWINGLVPDVNACKITCEEVLFRPPVLTKSKSSSSRLFASRKFWPPAIDVGQTPVSGDTSKGLFAAILPTIEDAITLSQTLCAIQDKGHHVQLLITDPTSVEFHTLANARLGTKRLLRHSNCTLVYSEASPLGPVSVTQWFNRLPRTPDVVLALNVSNHSCYSLPIDRKRELGSLRESVVVRLRRHELPHTLWMASLPLKAWSNWHKPTLDISVITNNRPKSLQRLFRSLSRSFFFGDTVDVQIYLEQTADTGTLDIANAFSWEHGQVYEHHRIIQGGLMSAVVESWYPHGNHTYGLLLEDDTELSPQFYAWIKMNLLSYQYGESKEQSPKVFGISLYQQKILELRPEGRRGFNASSELEKKGGYDPLTPYLSPIPCSWGAVYFPAHWRAFHQYLTQRLLGSYIRPEEIVVPGVRSNSWSKSWKKYFIEFSFLHGLVMVYPNYPNFTSLSTNHLELGSHVKARTATKQELFLLPLLQLQSAGEASGIDLLSLPGRALPSFNSLPVFNLTGHLTSLTDLGEQGNARCKEFSWCEQISL